MNIEIFNINQALNGASIGFISGDKVAQYIINFKYSNERRADKEFVGIGQDDSKEYYFDKQGICSDNLAEHKLYRIEDKISFTTGTTASRGESAGAEMISIENMQPRELFAQTAMQSILAKIEEPILGIDDFKIAKICELSFKIAQKMLTTAAECRAETKESEKPEDIEVDINTITSVSDKLLYNIAEYLKKINEAQTQLKDKGLKFDETAKITLKEDSKITIKDNVNVVVTNEPNVKVINTVDTYVNNTVNADIANPVDINVLGQPISVTLPSEEA